MAFEPRSGEHAIIEAVFGLKLSRALNSGEIETLARNHDKWKDELPRLARHEVQQIVLGEGVPQAITVPGGPGVSFERIKPNGDIAWRLRYEGNALLINCLEYNGWTDVWATALRYMREVVELIGPEKLSVAGSFLQYIDAFDWMGDEAAYDIFQLLNPEGQLVPPTINQHGSAWHLHQGWFVPLNGPIDGRLLQKAHFDAIPKGELGYPSVRMDTLMRADFSGHVSGKLIFEENSPIVGTFVEMHDRNKQLLEAFLTDAMCQKIGLEQ